MTFSDDSWRNSYDRWKLASPPEYECECEDTSDEDDGTEPCPACNVEWADQYRGECDLCGSTGRVAKDEEPRDYAYEAWMRGRRDRASGIAYLNPPSGIDRTEWQNGWRDEDKIIKADDDEPRF